MRRGLLGAVQWQRAITLVVFGCSGTVLGNIRRVELIGMGEDILWMGDLIELVFCDLVHSLEF